MEKGMRTCVRDVLVVHSCENKNRKYLYHPATVVCLAPSSRRDAMDTTTCVRVAFVIVRMYVFFSRAQAALSPMTSKRRVGGRKKRKCVFACYSAPPEKKKREKIRHL